MTEKKNQSIKDLWDKSDKKNLEILKNPLKDPLHFLKLILIYGITKENFEK